MLTENKHAFDDRWTVLRPGERLPLRGWQYPPEGELAIDHEPCAHDLDEGSVVVHTFLTKSEPRERHYCARCGMGLAMGRPTFEMAVRHAREQQAAYVKGGVEGSARCLVRQCKEVADGR